MPPLSFYTVILESYGTQEVWIEQLSVLNHSPRDVLSAWGELAMEHKLISRKENELIQEKLDDADYAPVPLDGLSNIWYSCILPDKAHFGINVIKTEIKPFKREISHVVRLQASDSLVKVKQTQYEKQYYVLKGKKYRDRLTNKKRKQIERRMRYWRAKVKFLNYGNLLYQKGYRESLYTTIFDYRRGTYCSQLYLSNTYFDLILVEWVKLLFKEETHVPHDKKL